MTQITIKRETPPHEPDRPPLASSETLVELAEKRARLFEQISKVIVGQRWVVENIMLTIFCGGHALLLGVPGLAKTLLIKTLSEALDLSFKRIQFTPDIMPSDITGTDIIEEDPASGKRRLEFLPGPIFANLILADEINRTPPKTQAAMLQAMQEREVSIGTKTYPLPVPFHVFATQNPIEMEGTYELPEAQADRFMFCIKTHYPSLEEEMEVVRNTTGNRNEKVLPVLTAAELMSIQQLVRSMPVSDEVVNYAVRLVNATRPDSSLAPEYIREFVRFGASPRASQYLVLGAKAYAAISGKPCSDYQGIQYVAEQVLRHRLLLNYNARAQKIETTTLITRLLKDIPTIAPKH